MSSACPELQSFCESLQNKCYDMLQCGCLQKQTTGAFSILISYISLLPFLVVLLSLGLLKYLSILLSIQWSEAFRTEVWISHVKGFDNFLFWFGWFCLFLWVFLVVVVVVFHREVPEAVCVDTLASQK